MIEDLLLYGTLLVGCYFGFALILVMRYRVDLVLLKVARELRERGRFEPIGFAVIYATRIVELPVWVVRDRIEHREPALLADEAFSIAVVLVLEFVCIYAR